MLLYAAGVIILIGGAVVGVMAGSFGQFMVALVSAAVSSALFFGLGKALSNQREILTALFLQQGTQRKTEKTVCLNCRNAYDADCAACPSCGRKNKP